MKRRGWKRRARIVFVTGTDTGVGKTVLTCLLLAHLRGEGVRALGLKPFCSGGRGDAEALRGVMLGFSVGGGAGVRGKKMGAATERRPAGGMEGDESLTIEEVNRFYFDRAVAPRVAAEAGRLPVLKDVVKGVEEVAARCDVLLIEGAGGLLVPLGKDYTVADLIWALGCEVVVASRNALGTINHTLLTVERLQGVGVKGVKVVLMGQEKKDASVEGNLEILRAMAPKVGLFELPFLGRKPLGDKALKKSVTFLKKTLARIMEESIVSLLARKSGMIESRLINKTR